MSIKYLQDQQLNQVQQSPNNSPWAKLIAQSEMLERNKMRQPQGQAPQGTVAGNIQQQLIDAQMKQESETQNADLYKSQMLAQLIGSGQIPANFSAQGYADGGLTQPQAGTGAYRGIVLPGQTPQLQGMAQPQGAPISFRSALQPDSQDPNAQEKKHGMLQSLLDNSIVGMAQGKANIGNAMQDYADLFSGKVFSRGFAEGGDIRGFAAGGESMAEQLARIKPEIEATLRDQGWTKEVIDRYVSAYKPEMGRGFTNQFPATTAQPPSLNDMLEMQRRKMAQTGLGVSNPDLPGLPPSAEQPSGLLNPNPLNFPQRKPAQYTPQQTSAMETLAQSPEAQKRLTGPQGRVALPHIAQVSESPELQEYYKSLYEPKPDATRGDILSQLGKANAPGEGQMRIPTREDMMRQAQGPSTGTDSLAEFKNRMYGADPSVVNPARSNLMGTLLNVAEQKEAVNPARSNLMGTLLNVAEQKEALANQPKPSMTEKLREAGMAGYNDNTILDTMANKMSATDRINAANRPDIPVEPVAPDAWSGAEAGKGLGEELKGVGQGIAGLFKGPVGVAGKALRAVAPVGDLMAVHDVTGSPLPMLAKAAGVNVPSSIGGVPVSQGGPSQLAMDLMGSPTARLNQVGSGISDAAQYVGDKATSAYDQFKNRLNAPPSVPQTDISQMADLYNKAAIPQQPTIGDFSGSATPQTKGPAANEKGVITNPHSANKHESTTANTAAINQAHGQGQTQDTSPVTQAVQQAATVAQADQAANKTSDTGMGQGSILDSLYSKLKDTDVDYSDLAKRISENEYDLARERKDGTFNAILGGVGAALSKAGSYEGVGDRVFKPGLGAIAGAGITGGLKMSAASDEAISKKSQDNMTAMLALKKLKRESMNDVLDALSAQKQNEVYAQSVANTALSHRDTAANNAMKTAIDFQQLNINNQVAHKNMEHLDAQIADLYNKASSDPNIQGKVSLAADKARMTKDVLTSLINGMVQPSDPRYIEAMSNFNAAYSDLNSLGGYLKIPTTVVAPNAGSSGANPRGTIVSKTPIQQ